MNLAPNGKPSNLKPEQYRLVRTPAFKEWFGDWEKAYETGNYDNVSKVIDENGEPKVKWRGDNNPKNVFDYINYGEYGVYYFADKYYAENFGDKLNSYFINSKNPFLPYSDLKGKKLKEIKDLWKNDAEIILKQSMAGQGYREGNIQDLHDYLENYYLWDKETGWFLNKDVKMSYPDYNLSLDILLFVLQGGINFYLLERKEIIDWIKNKNYDGYISFEGNEDNIAVFNSTQIKLADGTNKTFDGNNPDIRFKKGGQYLVDGGELNDFVLYHGTRNAKKVIQALKDGSFIYFKSAGVEKGIYLTSNKKLALEYANDSQNILRKGDDIGILEIRFNKIPNFKKYNNYGEQYYDEKKYSWIPNEASIEYTKDLISNNYDGYSIGEVYLLFKEKIDLIDVNKTSVIRYELGGEITLTSEQVEKKLGRKLHWWNDDVVTINGVEYKKVFLKSEYKRN
jgi:hypothetical protein